MKNENKFKVKSAKKIMFKISLSFTLSIIFANTNVMMVNAGDEIIIEQITKEALVFDTNSTYVMDGLIPEEGYSTNLISENNTDKLNEMICREITNRIDVCKANTAVSETTENISELVDDIEESKQNNDLIEKEKTNQEAAEMAVCRAASKNVPNNEQKCNSNMKTYMPYTAVTSKTSDQYKLLYSDKCYTDPKTGLRMFENRYCIALGTGYCSKIGTKIDLVLENGNVIKCILGDIKSDNHTDNTNRYHLEDGSVAEFIVDYSVFNSLKDSTGTVNWIDGFDGKIEKVVVFNE